MTLLLKMWHTNKIVLPCLDYPNDHFVTLDITKPIVLSSSLCSFDCIDTFGKLCLVVLHKDICRSTEAGKQKKTAASSFKWFLPCGTFFYMIIFMHECYLCKKSIAVIRMMLSALWKLDFTFPKSCRIKHIVWLRLKSNLTSTEDLDLSCSDPLWLA